MKKMLKVIFLLRHKIKIFVAFLTNNKSNRIIIVATPTHGNLGDQAIVYAEKKTLKSIFPNHSIIEIENGAFLRAKSFLKKRVKSTDIIVIDGGGNLGTIWPWEDDKISDIILTFNQNKIVVFPQTAYYEQSEEAEARIEKNKAVYSQAKDLTVLLRDERSLKLFDEVFPSIKAKLCPDIVLSLNQRKCLDRDGVLLCLRTDREKAATEAEENFLKNYLKEQQLGYSLTSTVIEKRVFNRSRKKELNKKWQEFSRAKLVITDRLHAMIFSYITATPCIAINNSSKKVEGAYKFISNCGFIKMADDLTEAVKFIPELMDIKVCDLNDFTYPIDMLEEILKDGEFHK